MASISFRVATTTSLAHNNRENNHGNPDIDLERISDNVIYIKKEIQEVYKNEFDRVVKDYNEKQKRSDRKIKDYYSKILNSKSTHHQRELIVAVGKVDDGVQWELKKEVLDQYMSHFQERNPNLKVYNAVMHLDETNPHLHINYVPVYDASRGLKKRVGHDQAIKQQGGERYQNFTEWQEHERTVIEKLMSHYEVEREKVGSHRYMSVASYKNFKEESKELKGQVKALDRKKEELEIQIGSYKKVTKTLEFEKSELDLKINHRLLELQSVGEKVTAKRIKKVAQKSLWGRENDRFVVEGSEIRKTEKKLKAFEVVYHHNQTLKSLNHQLEDENKILKGELDEVKLDRDRWRSKARENDELIVENKALKKDLKEVLRELEDKFRENEWIIRLMTVIPSFRKMKREQEKEQLESSKRERRLVKGRDKGGISR